MYSILDIEFPDQRKLREMPKLPKIHQDHGKGAKHQTKNLQDWRGPELVQNTLIYKQYGIQVSIVESLYGLGDLTHFSFISTILAPTNFIIN